MAATYYVRFLKRRAFTKMLGHKMLGLVKKGFAHAVFAMAGWSFKGELPKASKTVFIAAPHTSNWDFVLLVLCAWHFDLRL